MILFQVTLFFDLNLKYADKSLWDGINKTYWSVLHRDTLIFMIFIYLFR